MYYIFVSFSVLNFIKTLEICSCDFVWPKSWIRITSSLISRFSYAHLHYNILKAINKIIVFLEFQNGFFFQQIIHNLQTYNFSTLLQNIIKTKYNRKRVLILLNLKNLKLPLIYIIYVHFSNLKCTHLKIFFF